MTSLPDGYRAIVIGASGGIGSAMVDALRADPRCALVEGLNRHSEIPIDFDDELSIASSASALRARGPFQLIVHAAGVLHTPDFAPEKKLDDLGFAQMEQTFRVNAFAPALVIRHFAPLLDRDRSILALLSARVGSIGDNRLGGWYSYRASKAALNMFVRTASIELARTRNGSIVVALHPGTVDTRLSAPFRGAEIGQPRAAAVQAMLATLDAMERADSGSFVAYDGKRLPW